MDGKLLFPGSFDPFTVGHRDIVCRALAMGARVVVAVGVHPEKHGMFSIDERMAMIRKAFEGDDRVEVTSYEGLTTDFAQRIGATALLRSCRSVKDFEYERDLADMNRRISVCERYPDGIDTIIFIATPEHAAVSSSSVRELLRYGHDASPFLP